MDLRPKTACFTGHRIIRPSDTTSLYTQTHNIVESLILKGYTFFGAGGARGFDAMAAQVVIDLKEIYPNIRLILVLPFKAQYEHEQGWTNNDVKLFKSQLLKASKVVYTQENYSSGCYYVRDRHLVDHSSVCICYQFKTHGGTAYTTEYAKKQGLKVINTLNPSI